MFKAACLLMSVHLALFCWGQNTIGLPDITNYSKQSYHAGAQNRQIRQDYKGYLYFANNEGVLVFNGVSWKLYPLPNKSIVRSLEFGPDNKLYVGGQDEFGYFTPSAEGRLVFTSLKHLIPQDQRSFTDVWEIFFVKNLVFFQTSNKIFQFSGKSCTIYNSVHWRFITKFGENLVAQDFDKGLLMLHNGIWKPFLQASELPPDYFATSLTQVNKETAILTTLKSGVFRIQGNTVTRINSPFLASIQSKNISSSCLVNEKQLAIATNLEGCHIIDLSGNHIQTFSRKEGLQNNNILEVYLDREKNLWLGLDNGIDFIPYNNAIKHIYPDFLNEGSGYASIIHNNLLYIGTSNGLYKVPLSNHSDLSFTKGSFQLVPKTSGQVYNLSEVNNMLLLGHHDGAFRVLDNQVQEIDKTSGFWTFLPTGNVSPSPIVATGTYNGINFYHFDGQRLVNKGIHAHFESARFVVIDNGAIWVSHPYKGLYKVELKGDIAVSRQYSSKDGAVTSTNGNYIFKVRNQVILTTEHGIFEYNSNQDRFEPSESWNSLFKGKNVRYLKEDSDGNVWFVYDKVIGVVDMSSGFVKITLLPELTNKFVSGFEFVYPINRNNVLVGGEKGFFNVNFDLYRKLHYKLQVAIVGVTAFNNTDSALFSGYFAHANEPFKTKQQSIPHVSHAWNSFQFEFAAPVYAQQANVLYSFKLEGFDREWSEYGRKTTKDYTNVPAGFYTFKVRARNNLGQVSEVATYSLEVLPPWYQSLVAYFLYLLAFSAICYYLYIRQKRKFKRQQLLHEEEQKKLQYLHQLELEKNEKEIIKLKNEKLEAEINFKNTELASSAMHLVQKGEKLVKIKDELTRLKKKTQSDQEADDVKRLLRMLTDEEKMDKDWDHFSAHFDKVHTDFTTELKRRYDFLTAHDLKLCTYLRMNLSSKEIAQLMGISVRGVELSRYRLRKKLQLDTSTHLFDFLMAIHSPNQTPG